MANSQSGGSNSWLAFLVGGLLVAVLAIGVWVYSGQQEPQTADIEMNIPDVEINPPDIDLPDPPPLPEAPQAEPAAPAQ